MRRGLFRGGTVHFGLGSGWFEQADRRRGDCTSPEILKDLGYVTRASEFRKQAAWPPRLLGPTRVESMTSDLLVSP